MARRIKTTGVFLAAVLAIFFWGSDTGPVYAQGEKANLIADVIFGSNSVSFHPKVSYMSLELSVSKPDKTVFQKTFSSGSMPYFQPNGAQIDGFYTYELLLITAIKRKIREEPPKPGKLGDESRSSFFDKNDNRNPPIVQTGHFLVKNGRIVTSDSTEYDPKVSVQDYLIYDDLIVTGNFALGFDASNGENFETDTFRLKEHDLRIHFQDTSYESDYPTNDWRIIINDIADGGANYFAIEDSDGGVIPFKIEAGARANSLYVDDGGRVGLGTSVPAMDFHVKRGDTPTLRLAQDSSGGFVSQTWDVSGNEASFFVRDTTNGSLLPFRIQPGAPSNALCLRSNGKVGIGTWSPTFKLEVETTGENSTIVTDRTDGATTYMNATASWANFGSITSHPVRIVVNSAWKMRINPDGTLDMSDGGGYNGTWNGSSSREVKENIQELSTEDAKKALVELEPVEYNYKAHKQEKRVGFIAEDVPSLIAMEGRKNLAAMDVVAVLTKVVQDQQKTIEDLLKRIDDLENKTNKEK